MRNRGGRDGRNAEGEKKRTRGKNGSQGSNSYPKPLDLPLVWSTIICASVTAPNCLKYSRNSPAFCFLLLEKKRERFELFFPLSSDVGRDGKKMGEKKKKTRLPVPVAEAKPPTNTFFALFCAASDIDAPPSPHSPLARGSLGTDSLASTLAPSTSCGEAAAAASASSSSKKVTKPKPRELRVMRSRMTVCCVVFWMRVLRGR